MATLASPRREQVNRSKRACAYIRLSSDDQVKFGYNLEGMTKAIKEYAEDRGYALRDEDIFEEEEGESGRKAHRPKWKPMLEAIKSGSYDVCIIWRLDRTARRSRIGYKLKDACEYGRCEIESVTEDSIGNRMMFGMKLIIAEEESAAISDRVRLAFRTRTGQGKIAGKTKYGYRINRDGYYDEDSGKFVRGPQYGLPVEHPEEAAVVRRIFREYAAGRPTIAICAGLHSDGILRRSGVEWNHTTIARMIKATHYIGHADFGKRHFELVDDGESDISRTIWTNEDDWISVKFPRLVDDEMWAAAQARLSRTAKQMQSRGYKEYYPLRHKISCSICGCKYVPSTNGGALRRKLPDGSTKMYPRRNLYRAYTCRKGRYRGKANCPRYSINANRLEAAVWEHVEAFILDDDKLQALHKMYMQKYQKGNREAEERRIAAKIKDLRQERETLLTMRQKGHLESDEELEWRLRPLRAEMQGLEAELRGFANWRQRHERQLTILNQFSEAAANIRSDIKNYTKEQKNKLMEAMIEEVIIDKIDTPIQVRLIPGAFVVTLGLSAVEYATDYNNFSVTLPIAV